MVFGGVEVSVTFYLRKDVVEAFDVRFDTKDLERFVGFLKTRYGEPGRDRDSKDDLGQGQEPGREVYKMRWEKAGERAVLAAQLEKRRASLSVCAATSTKRSTEYSSARAWLSSAPRWRAPGRRRCRSAMKLRNFLPIPRPTCRGS